MIYSSLYSFILKDVILGRGDRCETWTLDWTVPHREWSPRQFAAAIFGPPLPWLVSSIFSHEFELSTMETCCHRLFMDISVLDGHLYLTKYPRYSASGCDLDTECNNEVHRTSM